MRTPSILTLAALGLLATGAANNASAQSSTAVIGYYRFNVPNGSSLWTSGFVTKKDFQGQATSHAPSGMTTVITQSGATFGTFDNHYIEILDGTQAGLVLDILGNNGTTLTVEGDFSAGGYNIAQNVKYCVRKHATLGSIFKGGADGGDPTKGLSEFEDEIKLFYDNGTSATFYYDKTNDIILDQGQSVDKSDEIVYPGQGMLLTVFGARQLTFGGNDVSYVKETPTVVPIAGGGRITLVGAINPLVASAPLGGGLSTIEELEVNPTTTTAYTLNLAGAGLTEYEDEIFQYGLNGGVFGVIGRYYYRDMDQKIVDANTDAIITRRVPNGSAFLIKNYSATKSYKLPGAQVSN